VQRTHYDVLGITQDAAPKAVRRAYLDLARRHHPDVNQGARSSEEEMQSVNEAWHVLGDNDRRRSYDATLLFEKSARERGTYQGPAAYAAGPGSGEGIPYHEWRPFDHGTDDDEPTDADLDPEPIRGSGSVPRWITLAPAGAFLAALVVLFFGLLANSSNVLALGGVLGVFAVAGFILMPLIVMTRAERDPNL